LRERTGFVSVGFGHRRNVLGHNGFRAVGIGRRDGIASAIVGGIGLAFRQ
jgi:hypothetical protein